MTCYRCPKCNYLFTLEDAKPVENTIPRLHPADLRALMSIIAASLDRNPTLRFERAVETVDGLLAELEKPKP